MKKHRQEKILEIIVKQPVETQEQLKDLLESENFQVTQATLSRDIRELGLKKAYDSDENYRYILPECFALEFPPMFLDSVIGIDYAINTVVIRCHTGMANAACAMLDKMECTDIVGTIAGDDTIFVLMRTEDNAKALSDKMNVLIFN